MEGTKEPGVSLMESQLEIQYISCQEPRIYELKFPTTYNFLGGYGEISQNDGWMVKHDGLSMITIDHGTFSRKNR
jgi:hypothetical protein